MNYKKSICLLTSFESLNVQYHIQKNLYNFIAEKFDAIVLPKTVIINPGGIVTFVQTGIIDKKDSKLINALQTN